MSMWDQLSKPQRSTGNEYQKLKQRESRAKKKEQNDGNDQPFDNQTTLPHRAEN